MLSIALSAEVEERLDAVVGSTGCSRASLVQEAAVECLSEFEDIQITEQRLKDNQAGVSRTYTLEEAEREPGLAD